MKKGIVSILVSILFLWLTQDACAEGKGHKMLVNRRTWNYMSFYFIGDAPADTVFHSISIDGPVEFDGKQCYKFANKPLEEATNFFYEEDSKVYFYGIDYETGEYAWREEFDFDLKPGEKDVISVDTVSVNGEYYRRLKLMNDILIEGIGSLESGIFSDWGEVPGTFLGSKVVSVYDGEKCVFTTEDFTKPSVTRGGVTAEYIDPQSKVVYTYEPGSGTAMVKAGQSYFRGGTEQESEYEEIDEPGSPEATGDILILSKFTIDGHDYVVSKIGDMAFYLCKNISSITLPETLSSIGDFAFCLCVNLTKIEIPKSVTSIGKAALGQCDKLVSIVSHIEDPFDTEAFKNLKTSNVTLYVPKGCETKYRTLNGWNSFEKIVEMGTTEVAAPKTVGSNRSSDSGIYDLQGRRLNSKSQHGIYIKNKKKYVK